MGAEQYSNTGFAYLDSGKVLHISTDEKTAKQFSFNGKFEKVNFRNAGGYPVVYIGDKEEELVIYGDKMKEKNGYPIPSELRSLISRLV